MVEGEPTLTMLSQVRAALGLGGVEVSVSGRGRLGSVFAVTELAVAAVGAAGSAFAALLGTAGGSVPAVRVDRALASRWFASSLRPLGWEVPSPWDPLAGDYQGSDGWIRLHTNAPHHRRAALGVLGVSDNRAGVAVAVSRWTVNELEAAIVEAGGAAAAMRSVAEWAAHPQGVAVSAEPLVHRQDLDTEGSRSTWHPALGGKRPLAGLRVLDMTRVLAGPVATRLLAGWGAEVLRIDPPGWDEPGLVPEVTVGKRCARLDLRQAGDRRRWWELAAGADVLVHGYRPGVLEGLGVGAAERDERCPGLVDVSLDAYGWSGPWAARRGFDSLVQMSAGIADAGRVASGADRPVPLPVQALDHATGYFMAAAALAGLAERERTGRASRWQASLARTAKLLIDAGQQELGEAVLEADSSWLPDTAEGTAWGPARRLPPPLQVTGIELAWELPARPLGHDEPAWAT